MDKIKFNDWCRGFVADLTIGGERVPLERVIAARLDGFVELRNQGLTWRAIEALILRAGGRRKDGTPISGDQLRVVVARLLQRRSAVQARPPPSTRPQRMRPAARRVSLKVSQSPNLPTKPMLDASDKDVSNDEMIAALARIQKKV